MMGKKWERRENALICFFISCSNSGFLLSFFLGGGGGEIYCFTVREGLVGVGEDFMYVCTSNPMHIRSSVIVSGVI